MLVLLPPSEGKAASGAGAPVAWERLVLPELAQARERVLGELVALCAGPVERAVAVLGLTPRQGGEAQRNAGLRDAAALPAGELYTGVLYDALDLAGLTPAARERAERSLLVFSGLWGVLRVSDRVPPYRCSGGVRLPELGSLAAHWRAALAAPLAAYAAEGLVLDLRSAAYAALWRPSGDVAARTATVRVLQEWPDGSRKVVSHFNKATKGRLVRDLLEGGVDPASPGELADALRDLKYQVEAGKTPGALDVVVAEL